MLARTTDRAARVRRAAIVALGKLGGDDARAALVARWDASDVTADERRALAEALGKVGGEAALDAPARARSRRRYGARAAPRSRAVDGRIARRVETPSREVATDVDPPSPVVVRLRCKPGLGAAARRGARARTASSPHARGDDAADVTLDRAWSALFAIAAVDERGDPRAARERRARDAIVDALVAPARALLAAWTRGPIRWRLGFARGHRRAVVWRVAKDVAARAPELDQRSDADDVGRVRRR